jgi:predicted Zn-ribbon and HTH transcriptional regulator
MYCMKWHCTSCNYLFDQKTAKEPNICPYCSKSGVLEKNKSAQDWVDEVGMEIDQREQFRR